MIFDVIKDAFSAQGFFSKSDLSTLFPQNDKNNLTRWCEKGYLIKLRNNYYAFPEHIKKQYFTFYVANNIYPSSYISLHTALSYHNFIANYSNIQINSISTRKTVTFRNYLGNFHYQKEQSNLHFGFEEKGEVPFTYRIATPEKAILDIFYLYPSYYDTEKKIRNFAIEGEMLYRNLNVELFYEYLHLFNNQALEKRIFMFNRIYGL